MVAVLVEKVVKVDGSNVFVLVEELVEEEVNGGRWEKDGVLDETLKDGVKGGEVALVEKRVEMAFEDLEVGGG